MAVDVVNVGPGTLTLGEAGTPTEFSTRTTEVRLVPKVDTDDDIYVLSGDMAPGDRTESFTLTGNIFGDFGKTDGLTEWCFENRGKVMPFDFVPVTALGRGITGDIQVEAIEIGGEAKKAQRSDFEFKVLNPQITAPTAG